MFIFSVDASAEVTAGPSLGRLVNHGDSARVRNARIRVLDGVQPCLCLVATKFIPCGTQVLYDYGIKVPWKKEVCVLAFLLMVIKSLSGFSR